MNKNTLIAVNSIAQFSRTVVNVVLGFCSTRIILVALGDSNYGLYTLVAGVVFLLSFVTNALSTTTQRFLSYNRGNNNLIKLKQIFGNVIYIHLVLSLGILAVLEIIGPFLFDGFLNIQPNQIQSAKITYQCVIIMVLCTCMASPFRGLLISHQNLIYTSIIDVFDGVLKLIIAVIILYCPLSTDKLVEYSILMTLINIFNLSTFSVYCFIKYEECIIPRFRDWSFSLIKRIIVFAGWVIYSTFMIVGRTQGTAIVLNKFLGTLANTAFGLANQLNSASIFVSGSVLNAFNPQIIKTEGEKNRNLAMRYAQTASKLCYLFMLTIVLPLCVYMEPIIKLWLGTVPVYSVVLGRIVLLTTLCDQITTGLSVMNKAIGKLKVYSLTVDTVKILTIPVMALLLWANVPVALAFFSFFIFELISACLRLPILKKQADISIKSWCSNVVFRLISPTAVITVYYIICEMNMSKDVFSIIVVSIVGSILLIMISYKYALDEKERHICNGLVLSCIKRIKRYR